MITVRVVHVSIRRKVSTLADYKPNKLHDTVNVSVETGIVTLSDLNNIKLLGFRLGIPQTATVTIEPGRVTFVYRVEKKLESSNENYPDQTPKKPWERRYPNEF